MASVTSPIQPSERVAFNHLLWVGPLSILAAIGANVIIQQIAVALLRPNPLFMPLTLSQPIIYTFLGGLGAVVVYAVIGRFARKPIQLFRRVAAVILVVSFIPDILIFITGSEGPGTTVANVAVLMLMHVVVWAITVGMLIRLARTEA